VFHSTMAPATKLSALAGVVLGLAGRGRGRPVRWKKIARLGAFCASPLFSSRAAMLGMRGAKRKPSR